MIVQNQETAQKFALQICTQKKSSSSDKKKVTLHGISTLSLAREQNDNEEGEEGEKRL